MPKTCEIEYTKWQNRAFRFYLASRLLYRNELYGPAAFCSFQAIENLLKGTLVYYCNEFKPRKAGHRIEPMISKVNVMREEKLEIPGYLISERYQEVTRYPKNGLGVGIPATFLDDLDRIFVTLVELVSFQFNSEMFNAIKKMKKPQLKILSYENESLRQLKSFLKLS
jgi:HEPN domain-containing protein